MKLISNSPSLCSLFSLPLKLPPPTLSHSAHTPSPPALFPPLFFFFSSPTCIALSASRSPSPLQASEKEKESPVELTERCFRELLGRAAYGNIKNAVTPVLMWVRQLFHTQKPVVVLCCYCCVDQAWMTECNLVQYYSTFFFFLSSTLIDLSAQWKVK